MIRIFNKYNSNSKKINICSEFPKKIVVDVFKPYLLLYINSKHLLIPILKKKAAYELYNKLLNFQKFNPFFGRSKITYVKKNINNQVKIVEINKEYNDKHILFENNNNKNFLCDHLSYIHKHYVINTNTFYEDSAEEEDDDQTQNDDISSEDVDIDNEIVHIEEG